MFLQIVRSQSFWGTSSIEAHKPTLVNPAENLDVSQISFWYRCYQISKQTKLRLYAVACIKTRIFRELKTILSLLMVQRHLSALDLLYAPAMLLQLRQQQLITKQAGYAR